MTDAIRARFDDMAEPQVAADAAQAVMESGVLDEAETRGALLALHLMTVILDAKPETEVGANLANLFHDTLKNDGWAMVNTIFGLEFETRG
ncbi:hypothetical protein [Aeromicrobium sp. 179-A 4D2 NHS]|uniref:hypothetical protein n=1 Tax=Aeromicrobium sp. 179-A 4D2 NHS TaxID=3142375 RepID=UPI00399F2483